MLNVNEFDDLNPLEKQTLLRTRAQFIWACSYSYYHISLYRLDGLILGRFYNIETGVCESIKNVPLSDLCKYVDDISLGELSSRL